MPSYIVKAAPGSDWYCVWSTVVDSPTWVGDRDGLSELPEAKPERIARADKFGTSSLDGFFGWDDDEFIVMGSAPRGDGRHVLRRERLEEYIKTALHCLENGDDELVGTHHLLEAVAA